MMLCSAVTSYSRRGLQYSQRHIIQHEFWRELWDILQHVLVKITKKIVFPTAVKEATGGK